MAHPRTIDVRFPVVNVDDFMARFSGNMTNQEDTPLAVVIWTTTPWTLPANQAVALHPDLDYVVIRTTSHLPHGDHVKHTECIVIAEALLEPAMARYGREYYTVLARTIGSSFGGPTVTSSFLRT